jgi:predicted dithiol-disulfide oxidoreductase (DUF899 family)
MTTESQSALRRRRQLIVFRLDDDIFHTYPAYARGTESVTDAYRLLDTVPRNARSKAGIAALKGRSTVASDYSAVTNRLAIDSRPGAQRMQLPP